MMSKYYIRNVASKILKRPFSIKQSTLPQQRLPETVLFPNEKEGNVYVDNWSLASDGIVSKGSIFRNARLELLLSRLPSKYTPGTNIPLAHSSFDGKYSLMEAGDNLNDDDFLDLFDAAKNFLSTKTDLFVEDAAVIASNKCRIGIRVVTLNPATALIARSLLISVPPREVIPIARFDGWKFDPRNKNGDLISEGVWNGESYTFSNTPINGGKGQRPILVCVGLPGSDLAVQFIENKGKIVGANVLVGDGVPLRGLIDAIGHAASVVSNALNTLSVSLNSVSIVKGDKTALIVGYDDSVIDAAISKNMLYGAYQNFVSVDGVSAFWNGVVSKNISTKQNDQTVPIIEIQDKKLAQLIPNNFAHPVSHLSFYNAGSSKENITEEEAIKRLVTLTDENNLEAIKQIIKGKKLSIIGSASDAVSLI